MRIENLKVDLAISAAIALLITAGVYWLLHRLVVRRVEAFRQPLAALAGGNYQARLPAGGPGDEIGDLALAFNGMAASWSAMHSKSRAWPRCASAPS